MLDHVRGVGSIGARDRKNPPATVALATIHLNRQLPNARDCRWRERTGMGKDEEPPERRLFV
jgi:hypothetical protein